MPPPIPEGVRLLLSGVITLGITYMPALVVANESPLPVDQKLYIPFAGPWLDLGNRPGCGSLAIPCSPEGGYRALLVADGILQAVSAIEILAGLNQMKHHDAPARTAGADKPALLRVAPTSVGPGALGMIAVGRF
ncbi:MAG: hypothetical protein ABSC94_12925 [Polyangiaceae bacterium]